MQPISISQGADLCHVVGGNDLDPQLENPRLDTVLLERVLCPLRDLRRRGHQRDGMPIAPQLLSNDRAHVEIVVVEYDDGVGYVLTTKHAPHALRTWP